MQFRSLTPATVWRMSLKGEKLEAGIPGKGLISDMVMGELG